MDFYLDKELVFNRMIPNEMILSYISLRGLLSRDSSNEYVSLNRMAFSLLGDTGSEYKEALLTALDTGLEQLVSVGLVNVKNKLSCCEYILDLSPTQLDTQNSFFIKVSQEDVLKIFQNNTKINFQLKLLRYYLCIIGYLNHSNSLGKYKGKVTDVALKTIYTTAGISKATAIRYNNILTSQKIIFIYHSPNFKTTNIYSRYSDLELCVEYGKNKEGKEDLIL